jgi:hypothetical protein
MFSQMWRPITVPSNLSTFRCNTLPQSSLWKSKQSMQPLWNKYHDQNTRFHIPGGTTLHLLVPFLHETWSWALPEKPLVVQLLKNFPIFCGTRKFITVFTRACHWSLFWAILIQSIPPHSISLWSILILSTHLRLRLPSGIVPPGFPTNIYYAFSFSPFVLHALLIPFSLTWIILIVLGEEYKLWSSLLYNFIRYY